MELTARSLNVNFVNKNFLFLIFFSLFVFVSFVSMFFLTSDFKESLIRKFKLQHQAQINIFLPPSTLSVPNNCVSVISFWCDKFPIKLGAHQKIFVNTQLYTLTEEQMIIKTKNGVIVKFS